MEKTKVIWKEEKYDLIECVSTPNGVIGIIVDYFGKMIAKPICELTVVISRRVHKNEDGV